MAMVAETFRSGIDSDAPATNSGDREAAPAAADASPHASAAGPGPSSLESAAPRGVLPAASHFQAFALRIGASG